MFLKNVEIVDMTEFLPTLEPWQASISLSMTLAIGMVSILIQRNVIKMILKKSERAINRIIFFQQVSDYNIAVPFDRHDFIFRFQSRLTTFSL